MDYNVDELVNATRQGNYGLVIDIVDHPINNIHPNAANSDGDSAFMVCMSMIMLNESADSSENFFEERTCLQVCGVVY